MDVEMRWRKATEDDVGKIAVAAGEVTIGREGVGLTGKHVLLILQHRERVEVGYSAKLKVMTPGWTDWQDVEVAP